MNEVQSIEGMFRIFDAAVHMNAAAAAGMALNCGRGIDNLQLIAIRRHLNLIPRDHGDNREKISRRLPALRTTAGMIMGRLRAYRHRDGVVFAFANERAARKIRLTGLNSIIHRGMDANVAWHRGFPLRL
jgi:hypothetical protein